MLNPNRTRALLLTADSSLDGSFSEIYRELNIHTESVKDFREAADRLNRGKYEAVVLDADTVTSAMLVLSELRDSFSNRSAVRFVVATKAKDNEQALERGAHFLFHRPVRDAEIRSTLHSAYDLMVSESRRYFRSNAQLPVTIRSPQGMLQCSTLNISGNGMAVHTKVPLRLAATLDMEFALDDGFLIRASGLVAWHDRDGNSGINFHCRAPEMRLKLDAWLDSQFASTGTRGLHSAFSSRQKESEESP